jgi:hypothetical protein
MMLPPWGAAKLTLFRLPVTAKWMALVATSADGVSVPSGNASCATENTPLARAWARAVAPQSGGDGVVALPDGDPRIPIHSRRQRQRQRGRGRLGRQRPQQLLAIRARTKRCVGDA